jgi:lipoyl-dependent peroxiredoxin
MIRKATAVWKGTGKEGNGHLSTQSGVLSNVPYNYRKRFEDEHGTNPEELVAAAHAGCFTMKLSFVLNEKGFTPDQLECRCEITLEKGTLTRSHLILHGHVPGISFEQWEECVEKAKSECPISKLFNTTITWEAKLGHLA